MPWFLGDHRHIKITFSVLITFPNCVRKSLHYDGGTQSRRTVSIACFLFICIDYGNTGNFEASFVDCYLK